MTRAILFGPVLFALTVSCAQVQHPVSIVNKPPADNSPKAGVADGRMLFLKNCAHCHGADARGNEGPDLHRLDWTNEQIATRIREGKKGQMTAFSGKLSDSQIGALLRYIRTLE